MAAYRSCMDGDVGATKAETAQEMRASSHAPRWPSTLQKAGALRITDLRTLIAAELPGPARAGRRARGALIGDPLRAVPPTLGDPMFSHGCVLTLDVGAPRFRHERTGALPAVRHCPYRGYRGPACLPRQPAVRPPPALLALRRTRPRTPLAAGGPEGRICK